MKSVGLCLEITNAAKRWQLHVVLERNIGESFVKTETRHPYFVNLLDIWFLYLWYFDCFLAGISAFIQCIAFIKNHLKTREFVRPKPRTRDSVISKLSDLMSGTSCFRSQATDGVPITWWYTQSVKQTLNCPNITVLTIFLNTLLKRGYLIIVGDAAIRCGSHDLRRRGSQMTWTHDAGFGNSQAQNQIISP